MHETHSDTQRSEFLSRALLVGGAAVAGGLVAGPLQNSGAATNKDVRALQLVLAVEYTEEAFYRQALEGGALKGKVLEFAEEVSEQEAEHVAFVKQALGKSAGKRPEFDFGDAVSDQDAFTAAAARLEDLAVAAYNGQATNVSPAVLKAASTIVSVEARHAAWIRSIVGDPPAPDATDKPMSADEVRSGLEELGLKG